MEEIEQKESQNIEYEVDTIGIIIYWKQRNGKTAMALSFAMDYTRVYSNFSIYHNKKQVNKTIDSFSDLKNIRFSRERGLIIIDESGLNYSSRKALTKTNSFLTELLFLVWKKNCDLIWIAQRFESIDINARVLSTLIIEMKKIRRYNRPPIFIITKKKQVKAELKFVLQYKFDIIQYMENLWYTYNTLEESKLKWKKEEEEIDFENLDT